MSRSLRLTFVLALFLTVGAAQFNLFQVSLAMQRTTAAVAIALVLAAAVIAVAASPAARARVNEERTRTAMMQYRLDKLNQAVDDVVSV